MITAKGFVKIPVYINLINAGCNLVISLLLIKYLGIIGVVLGTTIPMVLINFPCFIKEINRIIGTNLKEYLYYSIGKNVIIYIYCGLLSYFIQRIWYPRNLMAVAAEMGLIYAISIFTGYQWLFSLKEREYLKNLAMSVLGLKNDSRTYHGA